MTQNPEERIKELEDLLRDGLMYEPGDHPFEWYQNVRRALGEPLAERPGEPEADAVMNAVDREVAFRRALPEPQPMTTFRPDQPCIVYDELNNEFFRWDPEWGPNFLEMADIQDEERGVVEWDGMLLAGWFPEEDAEALGFPSDRTVKRVPAPRA